MACRIATSFAAVAMGILCIATDASATCKFKAKKDIIVILDVGHTDKDSGQISARGVKEYDLNMKLARQVLEELVNTGFISTQMIVTSGSNTHESRLQRSKRANDLGADLYRVPEIVTRGRFPDGGESDSTWRTQEARHVGSDTIAPGF